MKFMTTMTIMTLKSLFYYVPIFSSIYCTRKNLVLLYIIAQKQQVQYIMMMNPITPTTLENERFRTKLQASMPNYAYQVLMLEIIVEDDFYPRKPTLQQISRLIQLYMLAVEVLESAADTRYDYFKRKIHSLMMKRHIVELMHQATGKQMTAKTKEDCERAELQKRKNQHEAQIYYSKTDSSKVQEILKKAQLQVKNLNSNLRKNIISQQKDLQERIKNRKMKSETGSVSKFKIGAHNAQAKDTPPRPNKIDPRMQYFQDYGGPSDIKISLQTPKKIVRNQMGSSQKLQKLQNSRKTKDFI